MEIAPLSSLLGLVAGESERVFERYLFFPDRCNNSSLTRRQARTSPASSTTIWLQVDVVHAPHHPLTRCALNRPSASTQISKGLITSQLANIRLWPKCRYSSIAKVRVRFPNVSATSNSLPLGASSRAKPEASTVVVKVFVNCSNSRRYRALAMAARDPPDLDCRGRIIFGLPTCSLSRTPRPPDILDPPGPISSMPAASSAETSFMSESTFPRITPSLASIR